MNMYVYMYLHIEAWNKFMSKVYVAYVKNEEEDQYPKDKTKSPWQNTTINKRKTSTELIHKGNARPGALGLSN